MCKLIIVLKIVAFTQHSTFVIPFFTRAFEKLESMSAINVHFRLDIQDLRPTHRSTKHPFTERQLQTAVASFEETGKLTATERDFGIPRRAIKE